jgi:hypothetical protein
MRWYLVANTGISFQAGLSEEELVLALRNAGHQTELGDFTGNGGDLILKGNQVVGWLYQDDMGILESLEILPAFRSQGMGRAVLQELFGGQPFRAFLPNPNGMALLRSYGDVTQTEDGYVTVTPKGTKLQGWLLSTCRFA